MHKLKIGLLLLLFPLFAFVAVHKFYVSVTNVGYSKEHGALQITSRIFIDDLEAVLKERYGVEVRLATEDESEIANGSIERYLRAKFVVEVDGEPRTYDFLGKKYDNDVIICYIEVPDFDIQKARSISIENEILTDLFDEQQNIVHFKIDDRRKSFVLVRENDKGMLKL